MNSMKKGPGLYADIGKKARDLLYKDYQSDQKFTFTTHSPTGVVITSTGNKKGNFLAGDINTRLKKNNITTDIKVDTNSNLSLNFAVDECASGLKTILNFRVPDQRSGKVEVQYNHENVGINSSVGLTANPIVNFGGVIGTNTVQLGTDLAYDTKLANFTKCNLGLSVSHADLTASVTMNGNGDNIKASYYQTVHPSTLTAVGAEVSRDLSKAESTITVGGQHALDRFTLLKGRLDSLGVASALIQHEWRPSSLLTLSAELDTISISRNAKVGLALSLKP